MYGYMHIEIGIYKAVSTEWIQMYMKKKVRKKISMKT